MTLENNIRALITQYQKLQQRHQFHAQNAYYKFQSDMWQAMADDFGIIVEDLQQAGIFYMKGAVSEVATQLGSSEATIYRYLSKLKD